jgi:hypothetical protein
MRTLAARSHQVLRMSEVVAYHSEGSEEQLKTSPHPSQADWLLSSSQRVLSSWAFE